MTGPLTVNFSADTASFEDTFALLSDLLPDLADAPLEFVDSLLTAVNCGDNIVRFETVVGAPGASELTVRAEPTDFLLGLVTAVRAHDFDLGIFKNCLGHDCSSVGWSGDSNEDRAPGESQGSSGCSTRNSQDGEA